MRTKQYLPILIDNCCFLYFKKKSLQIHGLQHGSGNFLVPKVFDLNESIAADAE